MLSGFFGVRVWGFRGLGFRAYSLLSGFFGVNLLSGLVKKLSTAPGSKRGLGHSAIQCLCQSGMQENSLFASFFPGSGRMLLKLMA